MKNYVKDSKFNVKNSNRSIDENGYMTINNCILTKEGIAEYLGSEIPRWQELGLDPLKTYKVYRPLSVLEENVDTFNNLPITLEHPDDLSAESFREIQTFGSTGEKSFIEDGCLCNNMIIYDNEIIALIQNGELGDLSCGYFWDVEPSNTPEYNFIITKIKGNHLAIVESPRIEGAKIADSIKKQQNKTGANLMKKMKRFFTKDNAKREDSALKDSNLDEFREKLAHLLEEHGLEDKVEIEFKEEIEDSHPSKDESEHERRRHEAVGTGEWDVKHHHKREDEHHSKDRHHKEEDEHHSKDESEHERRRHEAVGAGEYDVEHGERAGGSYKKDSYTRDEVDTMLKDMKDELIRTLKEEEEEREEAEREAKDLLGDVACHAKDSYSIRRMILDAKGISTKGMTREAVYGAVKALKSLRTPRIQHVVSDSRKNSFSSDLLDRIGGL